MNMEIALVTTSWLAVATIIGTSWIWGGIFLVLMLALVFASDPDWQLGPLYLLITLLTGGLLALFGFGNPIKWAFENPSLLFSAIIEYLIIGGLYMFGRWVLYSYDKAKDFKDNQIEYTKEFKSSYYFREGKTFGDFAIARAYIPVAKNNKYRLMVWSIFWPFSMVHWVFHDMFKKIADLLVHVFGGMFDKVRAAIFFRNGVTSDMLNAKRPDDGTHPTT
jgi:hypothetical protein